MSVYSPIPPLELCLTRQLLWTRSTERTTRLGVHPLALAVTRTYKRGIPYSSTSDAVAHRLDGSKRRTTPHDHR